MPRYSVLAPIMSIYQCHRYDANTPLEETMAALTLSGKEKKLVTLALVRESRPDSSGVESSLERFVSSQPQYSMLWRKTEAEVFLFCVRYQLVSGAIAKCVNENRSCRLH